ncbi:MAG: FliH/SctL family protein [Rhodovibrio sp.]|nr:FliH/SctL family protein [Rhodovibrio sp.]
MAAAQKFMFGRDFAEEPVKPPRQAEPEARPAADPTPEPEPESEPAPTHSEEELAAARAEAHAQGHAAGLAEGRQAAEAEAERALSAALDRLAAGLETLAAGEAKAREARDRESLELCVGLLRRLFPALARKHGQGEIEQVFQDALERLRDEPRVVVRCADRHLDALKERVDGLAARLGFEGRVVLLADETMQPGNARVEWADGGVERDSERLWQDVERAVERALAPPAPALETASPEGTHASGIRDDGAARSTGDGAAEAAPADTTPTPAATPGDGRYA